MRNSQIKLSTRCTSEQQLTNAKIASKVKERNYATQSNVDATAKWKPSKERWEPSR